MQHWYAYHSDKIMGEVYTIGNMSSFYITKDAAGGAILNKKDLVWVIEGDTNQPCNFKLADCFIYTELKLQPFKSSRSKFKFNISGQSLLKHQVNLTTRDEWFKNLYENFIINRKPFYPLTNIIVQGLKDVSQINFKHK